MYRRVPCDWFLCDGIFKPVRLDSPLLISDALEEAGVTAEKGSFMDLLASEWIYRRFWTYSAEFLLADEKNKRAFLKLTGLKGARSVKLNGSELISGGASSEECEVTGRLAESNRIEIVFPPDAGHALHPQTGFGGMLLSKKTGDAVINSISADESGNVNLAVDCLSDQSVTVKYTLSCGEKRSENEFTENLTKGLNRLEHKPFDALVAGARNDILAELIIKKQISDEVSCCMFVKEDSAPLRGFEVSNEALIGLAAKAGANCAFIGSGMDAGAFSVLAARHGLSCLETGEGAVKAEAALQLEDVLREIAGRSENLREEALWKLTDSDKSCFDRAFENTASGDIDSAVRASRYMQAVELRNAALMSRANGKQFILAGADEGLSAPGSCAIIDDDRHVRPAYCALANAWRARCGFTQVTDAIPDDGIFSANVYAVNDDKDAVPMAVRVTAYDLEGNALNTSSFTAMPGMAFSGRFITEMPKDGACILRTVLTDAEGNETVSDEAVVREGIKYDNLPETQILVTPEGVVNAGKTAALGLCVKEAGFFGCLMPGKSIAADRAEGVEGLNIYF